MIIPERRETKPYHRWKFWFEWQFQWKGVALWVPTIRRGQRSEVQVLPQWGALPAVPREGWGDLVGRGEGTQCKDQTPRPGRLEQAGPRGGPRTLRRGGHVRLRRGLGLWRQECEYSDCSFIIDCGKRHKYCRNKILYYNWYKIWIYEFILIIEIVIFEWKWDVVIEYTYLVSV